MDKGRPDKGHPALVGWKSRKRDLEFKILIINALKNSKYIIIKKS